MADESDQTVRQGVAAAVILQLASKRASDRDDLRVSVLKLAAALVQLVELEQVSSEVVDQSRSEAVASALTAWRDNCAEVLAALSYPLAGLDRALQGKPLPTAVDSLPALAEKIAAQTAKTSEKLNGACGALRSQGSRLLQRAGQLGATVRAIQQERIRLKQDIEKSESAEKELVQLQLERGGVAWQVEALQERLRIANATPEECHRLEQATKAAEDKAAQLSGELKVLENRRDELQEQLRSLPERIEQTRQLIHDLETSPEREIFLAIQEIWKRLNQEHERGM